jgi:hypothetical protein
VSLENPNQVDAVAIDPSTERVELLLLDSEPWGDDESHLVALSTKLNRYAELASSGELPMKYPPAAGRRVCIRLEMMYVVPSHILARLEAAKSQLRGLDIDLEVSEGGRIPV